MLFKYLHNLDFFDIYNVFIDRVEDVIKRFLDAIPRRRMLVLKVKYSVIAPSITSPYLRICKPSCYKKNQALNLPDGYGDRNSSVLVLTLVYLVLEVRYLTMILLSAFRAIEPFTHLRWKWY
jgi:hypothetical protein